VKKLENAELNRAPVSDFLFKEKSPVILILDNVRSMHNVGSVFRTADAFAVRSICLCGITASPPHREIEKTALGATATVAWRKYSTSLEAAHDLLAAGWSVWAVEQLDTSISLLDFAPLKAGKYALVFGNEVSGVSEEVLELCTGAIEIPQFGTKHSFNVSVSAGIVLWDLYTKLA